MMELNEYQSVIDLSQYPEEVVEQFEDCINNIPYIKNLISKDRQRAKDRPRDEKGRIIVDITNPHILEDMDYFRQPALHFEKHKCYTFLRPSANPQSEYYKYWKEEIRRCREGYVRESDGEWVTGYCYWFMNYNPMMVNKVIKGSKRALRTESFPYMWEGIYLRFHYIQQAREAGLNWIELAKRGAHTYDQVVYTPDGVKLWGDIQVGDMLFDAHGGTTKVVDIPFNGYAECYKITLRDGREITASDDHLWNVKIHNHKNIELHTTKELLSIYKRKHKVSDHSNGIEYIVSILSNDGCDYEYHKPQVDPYTMGLMLGDGCFRHQCPGYYTQLDEDFEIERKYIPYEVTRWSGKYAYCIKVPNLKDILKGYGLFMAKSEDKFIPDEYKYNSVEVRKELLYGLIDTDGYVDHRNKYTFSTASERLRDDVIWICRSLGYNASYSTKKAGYKKDGIYIECLPNYIVTIHTTESLSRLPRKQLVENNSNLYKSRIDGTRIVNIESIGMQPCKCVTVDADDQQYLIGDFVTTHNCGKSYLLSSIMTHNMFLGENAESNKRIITVLAAAHKDFLSDSKDGTLSKFRPAINFIISNTPFPNLFLKNSPNEMVWQMGYKNANGVESGSMNTVMAISLKDDSEKLRGKRGFILYEEMGSMPNLLSAYDIAQRSVYDGDFAFGQQGMVGTAAESESDFSSAKTLLYAPRSYKIKDNPNVYDRVGQGKEHFGYFYPAYLNRAGCYNEDGVSDVTKALMEVLMNRYEAKYGANTKSVLRIIAEDPITPAEAIIKVKAAFFPVQDCNSRLTMLEDEHEFDDVAVGVIELKGDQATFRPTSDIPIHTFPVSNDTPGAIEFYQMPELDKRTSKAYSNRYIIGVDPVDNDSAESSSLYSTFVFDLWTDNIVAEFTGRKQFADDNFEITRRMALFYNAMVIYEANKKGIFAYFQKMNSTHLLAETPQYLRDRGMVKYTAFGSNAYGVNANAIINNYANQLIRDWLLKPYEDIVEGEVITRPNVYRIKAKALLEELVAFTPEINVDRIRALGMVMLLREQELINCGGDINMIKAGNRHENYLGDDPFFKLPSKINNSY